jgi:hypothetical protein
MTTGILEGAGLMGSVSIITVILSKLKCYVKKNGSLNFGCGFTDKNLIDDDETEIKTITVDDTNVFYISKKHHYADESE